MKVRVIALGNPSAGDDAAAIAAVGRLEAEADIIVAGRPGAGLLDLLESMRPTVLVDVIRSGAPPGRVVRMALDAVVDAAVADPQLSSHGFGPSETLRLGRALGRPVPPGQFVGIEGFDFTVGTPLSPKVRDAVSEAVAEIREAICELEVSTGNAEAACMKPE